MNCGEMCSTHGCNQGPHCPARREVVQDNTALLRQALEAGEHALRVLDNVYIDVLLADGIPAIGLLDSRKKLNAVLPLIREALGITGEQP